MVGQQHGVLAESGQHLAMAGLTAHWMEQQHVVDVQLGLARLTESDSRC